MHRFGSFAAALLVLGVTCSTSWAGYQVKTFIPGARFNAAAYGVGNITSSWPQTDRTIEMNGDFSSQELFIQSTGDTGLEWCGVADLTTGEIQWLPWGQVGIRVSDGHIYRDVDGDGLLDVIAYGGISEGGVWTYGVLVIGWVSESDAPAPSVETTPSRAFPNPNTGQCEVRFSLPSAGQVSVAVFDASGRRIRQVLDGHLPAGSYSPVWDGLDDAGMPAPAGVYFARVETAEGVQSAKVVLAR